jgi:hypothetical protein
LLRYVLRHNEEECGRLTDKFEDHDDLRGFLETLADGLEDCPISRRAGSA